MYVINPDYMSALFDESIGRILLVGGGLLHDRRLPLDAVHRQDRRVMVVSQVLRSRCACSLQTSPGPGVGGGRYRRGHRTGRVRHRARRRDEKAVVRSSLRQLEGYEVENVRDQELLNPLRERAIAPAFERLTDIGRRFTPTGYVDKVRQKFVYAGEPSADAVDRFLAIQVLACRRSAVVASIVALIAFDGPLRLGAVVLFAARRRARAVARSSTAGSRSVSISSGSSCPTSSTC